MYKNELAIVSIKPNLAYGSLGRKPDIPPDSRMTYLLGLLHFEKQKEISEMTWAQVRFMKYEYKYKIILGLKVLFLCFLFSNLTLLT